MVRTKTLLIRAPAVSPSPQPPKHQPPSLSTCWDRYQTNITVVLQTQFSRTKTPRIPVVVPTVLVLLRKDTSLGLQHIKYRPPLALISAKE